MKVDIFDYDLPRELIAKEPARPRDSARLLDITGPDFKDRFVYQLPDILTPGDLLIGNDTRVIPARLIGKRGNAKVEVTLHKQTHVNKWLAFAKPARKLSVGDEVTFTDAFKAGVEEKHDGGEVLLAFSHQGPELFRQLEQIGLVPLPPYIKRDSGPCSTDKVDYQTIYAKHDGAVAAPTAGLHFTQRLFEALANRGIRFTTLTLHVGAGTFLPVKVEDTRDHKMHLEWGCIDEATVELIKETRRCGGRIVSIGTTVMRLLETAADANGDIRPFCGDTDLFITPGYQFKLVDMLLTNFHLPRSTLFMLVCAFCGIDRMKAAYAHAIEHGYRFYSYGDCCLLKREQT